MPEEKRAEILEWVRRVILTGATDYRRYQALATKQRYAIRFPGVTYGGSPRPMPSPRKVVEECNDEIEDPDMLSGVIDAPAHLRLEMANLMSFKTATLTAVGFKRNGVWGEETASQSDRLPPPKFLKAHYASLAENILLPSRHCLELRRRSSTSPRRSRRFADRIAEPGTGSMVPPARAAIFCKAQEHPVKT
ncbi:hypothetical protein G6L68_22765 [Agrobacterium fabrum]|uniref:hypothetical protein n=1 Tax=Agrobacterium fabrum TaxID=1176649 RepID=UPI0013CECBF3|nr:hypothetical protein [Agrobacterium fabrum]